MRARVAVCLVVLLSLYNAVQGNNITSYQPAVAKIFQGALADTTGYDRLGFMCNTFGSRLSGSQSLEQAIDWVVQEMKKDGFDSVTTEQVSVTKWVRHSEKLEMIAPRSKTMAVLALGGSISTPILGITAEVIVVKSYEELEQKKAQVAGKIVVYNVPWNGYSQTVTYRTNGAAEAAKFGAVASLTRSITPFSLYTPHTGVMYYQDGVPQIPAAAITVEDANLLQFFQDQGIPTRVKLHIDAETLPNTISRNVIADLKGTVLPDEIVVFGGHIDSWDVGAGAHDDGGGVLQSWEALRQLAKSGMRPRRTIRVVAWTNEENGKAGANTYYADHLNEISNTTFCFESDEGTFTPVGFSFAGTSTAMDEVKQIAQVLAPYAKISVSAGGAGADVSPLTDAGVPGVGLIVAADGVGDDTYFWYHHTQADTFDHVDQHEFQQCVGTVASLAYIVADMADNLPRTK